MKLPQLHSGSCKEKPAQASERNRTMEMITSVFKDAIAAAASTVEMQNPFLHVLSSGSCQANAPWFYEAAPLSCYLLLYTSKGCGKLLFGSQVFTLTENTMVFCSCEKRFRLDAALSPWAFSLYLISGSSLKSYAGLLSKDQEPVVMDVPLFSDTALHLQKLPSAISSDQSSLLSHALLTDILVAGIIRHANQDPQPLLPSYLAEARILFDHHFEENYSLDELAMRFHVSKYRFCREFGTAFGETPLQYLNQKRIKVAKHLLLTTSLKIHEVGSAVGIDNTNHFISLFKKYTGLTPLVYRQTGMIP